MLTRIAALTLTLFLDPNPSGGKQELRPDFSVTMVELPRAGISRMMKRRPRTGLAIAGDVSDVEYVRVCECGWWRENVRCIILTAYPTSRTITGAATGGKRREVHVVQVAAGTAPRRR